MAGTTLGTAYVQILPSAKGLGAAIKQSLDGDAGNAGKSAGLKISSGIKKMIAGAAIGAGVTAAIKAAVSEGGKLEQSYGGLDTIYGKAADAARAYAQEAASAGISANDYAEQAVSFGASLKQAFEGDTKKAVEAANTAILDMTDNAAKMGTPIESIQMAYQGFAKQNYTMLDNLKLGYGGTKTEMERLLKDATKLSGVEYNMDNLGDVYDAIHVIQGDLGLTGVAAAEAATTFEGSFNAMKASAANLLGNLALGENIKPAMVSLATNASGFLFGNLIPMVGTVFKSLPEAMNAFLQEGFPKLKESGISLVKQLSDGAKGMLPAIPGMISGAINGVTGIIAAYGPQVSSKAIEILSGMVGMFGTFTPRMISMGSELLGRLGEGLTTAIPTFLSSILPIVTQFTEYLRSNAGRLIDAGLNFVVNLAQGIINSIPVLVSYVPTIITNIAGIINDNAPKVIVAGLTIIKNLVKGIINAIPTIKENIPKIFTAVISVWSALNWVSMGKNLITFVKNGIESLKTTIPETLKNIGESAKNWFGSISWGTLGTDIINLILTGIRATATAIPTAIKAIANLAVTAFKSINWVSVGKTALRLIVTGVGSAGGSMKSVMSRIVNTVKSTIKTGFDSAKASAVQSFESLRSGAVSKIESVRGKVKGVVDAIKGLFPLRIGNVFSGLKLPHFSVSGSAPFGIGGKGSPPKIKVSWYKKAMEQPYMFSNATLFGAGESGDEMLYGRRALLSDITSAVNKTGEKEGRNVYVTNYITVDGAENPEEFAERLVRKIELEVRTA